MDKQFYLKRLDSLIKEMIMISGVSENPLEKNIIINGKVLLRNLDKRIADLVFEKAFPDEKSHRLFSTLENYFFNLGYIPIKVLLEYRAPENYRYALDNFSIFVDINVEERISRYIYDNFALQPSGFFDAKRITLGVFAGFGEKLIIVTENNFPELFIKDML